MIYLSPGNKWSIPTILDEIKDTKFIEFLYRDDLGRIQKGKQYKKLMFKTLFRCGTKCTHCKKEGLHFELNNTNALRIATIDGFLNVEHIIPQSLGGTNIEYNVTIFCNICNEAKGNDLLVPKKIKQKNKNKTKKINNTVKKQKASGKFDSSKNIHFGKFVKELLLTINDGKHSTMHAIYNALYESNKSFKISENELDENIKRLNDHFGNIGYTDRVYRVDIAEEYYTFIK